MEGIGRGKGFVIETNLLIGLFIYKTQQITNLIQYWVAIHVPTTYNTTNTPHKLSSDHFTCTHNYPSFCIDLIQLLNLFQTQYIFLYIFLPNLIKKVEKWSYLLNLVRVLLSNKKKTGTRIARFTLLVTNKKKGKEICLSPVV